MTFPQEIHAEVISYLEMLRRKGVRSVYLEGDYKKQDLKSSKEKMNKSRTISETDSKKNELLELEERVKACKDCKLHATRKNTVFGVGNPGSRVLFIGEAPGREEDIQGEPFVGRAGKLLNKILHAIELMREDVYITNILKCRPPDNRDPVEDEVRHCEKYLVSQIRTIKPALICALGRVAAQWLLRSQAPLSALRLGEHVYEGIPVLVTYHPAALLRQPGLKKSAWEDFKKLKRILRTSQEGGKDDG